MKKLIILSILFFGLLSEVIGQQQAMFTQYMFNAMAINPAVVGSHGTLSMTALLREQWVGLEGAPSTQTLSVHSPLLNDRVGLGLTLMRDEIGVTRQHSVYGAYSYRIEVGVKTTLSLGVSGGISDYRSNSNELNPADPDMSLNDDFVSGMKPNFGTGVYLYSDRLYVGASAPFLLNYDFIRDDGSSEKKEQRRHYFVMAGYVFDLGSNFKLKPNFLLKAVDGAPLEVDINANLLIKEVLWLGASYRSFDSVDALIELQLNNQLKVGYAHDFTTTELARVNRGTHEIMVNYRFKLKQDKMITPRYF